MEMMEIMKDLERKLNDVYKPAVELWERKAKEKEEELVRVQNELEKARMELKAVRDDSEAIEASLEMLRMGSFAQIEEEKPTEKVEEKEEPKAVTITAGEKLEKSSGKELTWKHKKAFIVKLNQYDNVLDRWRSQKIAARYLDWDQSSVSKFMRLDKETQLKKKGYYLAWEY